MSNKSRSELSAYSDRRNREMREQNHQDKNTMYEIIDEAARHCLDHFAPPIGPQYRQDYVFIMGKAFYGVCKTDGCDVAGSVQFAHGDLHEWSHDLARYMAEDPQIKGFIFHAVAVFADMAIHGKGQCNGE